MKVRNENGTALVEFAITAPLLFLILFGIIEFGILLYDKAMLTNASREGARAGIVFNFSPSGPIRITNDDIAEIVSDYCASHLISVGGGGAPPATSVARGGTGAAGDSVTVTVSYQFRFLVISNLIALIGGDDIADPLTLTAETVMRLE
jgi:Flp pilus assembly protein TadG